MSTEINVEDIRKTYKILNHKEYDGVTEIRAIIPKKYKEDEEAGIKGAGYFDNEDDFVSACVKYNGQVNLYAGFNPRPKSFIKKAVNEIKYLSETSEDEDIELLIGIPIDIDPVRPEELKYEASTNEELELTAKGMKSLIEWAMGKGFKKPCSGMSGNGRHAWFFIPPIEINDENRKEIKSKLKLFTTEIKEYINKLGLNIKIDSIFDLSRVVKIIGTKSVKGTKTLERPHRISFWED